MTEPMDEFERRLADRLRGWTEPAAASRDHLADANALLSTASEHRGPRLGVRVGLAIGTIAAAALGVAVLVSLVPQRPPPAASQSPIPEVSGPAESRSTPEPSAAAGSEIDIGDIGWYTLVSVQFGTLTGADSEEGSVPDPYDLLTVGTLDGRVSAELHLSTRISEEGLEGAWANGPFGLAVLAGDDDGSRSRVFTVSVRDGSDATRFETDDAVVVGALAEDGGFVYFVPVDRGTRLDLGLWRAPIDGGEPEVVFEGPITETATDYASQWTMEWSADGNVLVTQTCRVRVCHTLVYDSASGASRLDGDGMTLIGVTDSEYVTQGGIVSLASGERRPLPRAIGPQAAVAGVPGAWYLVGEPAQELNPRAYALQASPLDGGPIQALVEVGASEPTQATLKARPDSNVNLPDGWILRWPTEGSRYMDIAVPPHVWYAGELINVVRGERLPVPPTHWPDTPAGCEPIPPSALPSGAVPGSPIVTPGGHFLWATWGAGDDQVVQSVGAWLFGRDEAGQSGDLESEVTVRGHPGRVIPMGSMDGPWAIAWEEDGCRYEVQLTPGTTQDETVAYAERYGALAVARPILVPEVVAGRPELPWCGHEIVERQAEGDYYDAAVRACFLDAYEAGEPAEFVSDGLTVEGGRWRTIFRSTGGGEVEVYHDSTADPLATPGWSRLQCTSILQSGTDPAGVPIFWEDECSEPESVAGEGGSDPTVAQLRTIEELIAFAQSGSEVTATGIPFADVMWLGLGDELLERHPRTAVIDSSSWQLQSDAFRERVGPFSALEVLADWNVQPAGILVREALVLVGPHQRCTSAPVAAPAEVAGLRRVSVQPGRAAACLSWWTVDLFFNEDGFVEAVTLDFGDP
jgi:hypothetical protein